MLSPRYRRRPVIFLHQKAFPPVDLHWFFEISIGTEKKFQLELKKKIQLVCTDIFFQFLLKFFFSSILITEKKSVINEKKNQLVYN